MTEEEEKKNFKINEVCKLIENYGIYWCGCMTATPSKKLYNYLKEIFIGKPLHIFACKPYWEYVIIDFNIHPNYWEWIEKIALERENIREKNPDKLPILPKYKIR